MLSATEARRITRMAARMTSFDWPEVRDAARRALEPVPGQLALELKDAR